MKNTLSSGTRLITGSLVFLGVILLALSRVDAATYYWDSDGNPIGNSPTIGTGLGGTGTWDDSSLLWYNSLTNGDIAWPNSAADTAIFTGTAGTVTIMAGGLNAGTMQFLTTGYTISGGQLTLGGAGSNLFVGSGVTTTINGSIGGSNGLGVYGPGTLSLTGLSTYTGNTSIGGGATLNLNFATNSTNLINNASPLVLNGGTLTLTGTSGGTDSQTFAGASVTGGGIITLTQGGATSLTVALGAITQTAGGSLNFSVVPLTTGVIATTSNSNVNGILGTWATVGSGTAVNYATVNGSNQIVAYTGGTAAATGANLTDTTGAVNYNLAAAAGTVPAIFSANTIRYTGAAATTAPGATSFTVNGLINSGTGLWTIGTNTITIGSNLDLQIITGTNGITITSVIQNNGATPSNLTYSGTGALTLSKANTYTGTTTVNSGTLNLGIANALNSASSLVINGGTFGEVTFADTVASVSLRNGSITGTTGVLTSTTAFDLQSGTVSAPLGGSAGLNKTTAGTVTLSQTTASTMTGPINIKAGTLLSAPTAVTALGSGTVTLGDTSGSADARLQIGGTLATVSNPIVLATGTTGNLSIGTQNASTVVTLSGGITGNNNLIISSTGAAAFTISSINNAGSVTNAGSGASVTTISALGALVTALNQTGASPLTLTPAWSVAQLGFTIASSGSGLFTLTGGVSGGTNLVFNANGTGGITVASTSNTGTITNSGTGTGTVTLTTIGAGVTALNQTGASALTLTPAWSAAQLGATITNSGAGLLTLTGGVTGGSNLVFNTNSSGGITVTAAMTATGTITSSGTGTGNVTLTAAIPATVTNIVQNGSGTLTLTSAANAYTGTTTVTSGTLSFAGTPATGATSGLGNSSTNIILGGATTMGTLTYTGAAATMTRNFTVNAGGGQINSTANTLTLTPGAAIDLTNGPLTLGTGTTAATSYITIGSATTTNLAFTGANALTKTGAGTVTLSQIAQAQGFITSAIPINVVQGTLQLTTTGTSAVSTSLLGSGLITLTPGATINLSSGNTSANTLTNLITIANAAGTATLSTSTGAFTWTGAVTFAAGANIPTLRITNSNGSASTWTMSGGFSGVGNIQLNPTSTGSAITLSTNAVNNTGTISNIGASSQAATISAAIGSNVTSITQAGANPFTISGAITLNATNNTFTSTGAGLWTFSGGFGTGAFPLIFNANANGNITVSTTAIGTTGTITNSGTGGGVTTISSNIGSSITDIIQSGANTQLVLSGTNTYTGNTTVSDGILDFTTTAAISGYSTSPATAFGKITVASGATLVLPYGGANSVTSADIANLLNGTYNVLAAGSSLGLDTTNATSNPAVLSTVLSDPGGTIGVLNFTKSGTNALTMGTANTYTGYTAIVNGTLNVSLINSVNGGTPAFAASSLGAPTTVANGTIHLGFGSTTGTLSYIGSGETTDRVFDLSGTSGGGGIDNSGIGLLTLTSPITFSGTGAKTLTFSGAGNITLTSAITGNGSTGVSPLTINKTGTGTLTLSGANTAQNITISGGILDTGAGGIILSDLGLGNVAATGTSTVNGKIFLGATNAASNGPDYNASAGVILTINAVIANGASSLENIDFNSASGGTIILAGANTFTGQVQINGAGILQVTTINSVVGGTASSNLGAPTTAANGTLLLNTAGILKYVGTGETTDRVISLNGTTTGATIDQSGTGLLKFTSNFATPGAGAKTFVLQGSTTGTGEIAGAITQNSTTNTTAVTKAGSGTWTLSGANSYTGTTTVNGGNLILSQGSGTGTMSNTSIVINSSGTLSPLAGASGYTVGNTATAAAGGKLTLNAGGTLNMADGTVNPFILVQNTTFAGNAAVFAGGTLNFDLGSATADQIDVRLNGATGTGQATSSGSNGISINIATGTSSLTPGSYTLINAGAVGSTLSNANFYLTSANLNVGGTLYLLSLGGTTGSEVLTVAVNNGAALTPNTAYWNGTTGASWAFQPGGNGTATNWSASANGTTDTFALPGSTTNVIFTTNNAGNLSSTLDQNFTINSLTFSGGGTANSAGSTIASGIGTNALTINAAALSGNTAGNGITVLAGAGADLISANVILGGSQTWTNNSTSTLTLSGVIGDGGSNFNLSIAGTGVIILSNAANTYGGVTTIPSGSILAVSTLTNGGLPSSIGKSSSAASNLIISGTLLFNGTTSVSDRSFTINAGATAIIDVAGSGNLSIAGATGTATTGILTKTDTGTLTLTGVQTYTGNTVVNNGTLVIAGTGSLSGLAASTKLIINPTAGNNAVVSYTSSATSTLFAITGATVAGTASAYYQSNGTVVMTPNTTTGTQNVVGANSAYGYYNISGGTLRDSTGTSGGSRFTLTNGGTAPVTNGMTGAGVQTGVIYVNGTGFIDHTNAEWWLSYSLGEITVADSGKIDHTGSNNPFAIFMDSAVTGESYGVLNLAGANAQVITGGQSIRFGNSSTNGSGNSGFVNLAAGTLSTGANASTSLNPNGGNGIYYNFAGGTLKATANLTQWAPTSNAAATVINTIYGAINNNAGSLAGSGAPSFTGGLTIDTNTFTVTVSANLPLLGATGVQVTQADLTVTGGSGYIGAPAVIFSKPASATGVPAAGYALISNGVLVGIVITDPGVYAAGETPIITLVGGGATVPATVTSGALSTTNTVAGLTKINSGTLTITGTGNTFGGPVDIKGGVLAVNSLANGGVASTLGASSNAASNLLLDGGILQFNGTVAGATDRSFTLAASNSALDASGTSAGSLTFTSNSAIGVASGLGAANLILQGTGTGTAGSGNLGLQIVDGTGTTVSLIKNGTGTWFLTNSGNTYSGSTTINAGILSVATLSAGGSPSSLGASSNAASNLVLSGGTLQYTGSGSTTDRNFTFGNATTAVGAGIDTTGATGPLVITGNMTAVNTAAGTQVLTLTSLAASGANALNGNIVDSSATALTGVTKSGAGAWTLGGANAYTGTTTVNAGTLNITGTNVDASPITLTSGGNGVLNINSSGVVNAGAINWAGSSSGVLNLNGGTLLASGNLTSASSTGTQLVFNGGTLKSNGAITISGNLPIAVLAGGGTIDTSGGSITSSSAIANTASPGTLNVIGGNTLQSAISATMTGAVNITGTGTTFRIVTTAGAAYPSLWTIGSGATLDINNLGNFSFGGLAGGGTILNTGASAVRTVTITGAGGNNFSGSIQQPTPSTTLATGVTVSLSSASAVQTFSGVNTYGGPTTITQGVLALTNGSLGNTAISVTGTGTLAPFGPSGSYTVGSTGAGTLGATLSLSAGGTISMVDNVIGTFTVNQQSSFATAGLTLASGSLNFEINSTGTDQIVITGGSGTAAISGANTINIIGLGTSLTPNTYSLLSATGITAGNTFFKFSNGTTTESLTVGMLSYTLSLTSVAGIEQLVVGPGVGNLTYTGQTNGNGAANGFWTSFAVGNNNFADLSPAAVDYTEGSAVTFQDLNSITSANVTTNTVTIDAAGVNPGLVTVNNNAVNYTFQNSGGSIGISGSTGLTKSGSGTLTLLGQNTYTGPTSINGGLVVLGVAEGSGTGPLGNGGVITFGGGTLQYTAQNNFDYSSRFSTGVGNLISIDTNGQNVTFATALTSPNGTLTKLGAGRLTLTAVNTFSGNITINGGTLTVTAANGSSGALGSPTITINAGAVLDLTNSDTLGFLAGRNALVINGGTVQNNAAGKRDTLINTVTMTGGTLAGTSVGDANGGAFSLDNATTAVLATSDAAGNPATISANVSTQAVAIFQVNRGTGAVAAGAPDLLISGPITPYNSGTNGVTYKGSGIVNITGANTYKGSTTILGGSLGGIVNANSTQALGNNTAGLIMGDTTGLFGTLNVNQNSSITTLQVNTSTSVVNTNINTINIATGKTLTNTGAVTIGVGAGSTNFTSLIVTGDTWSIGTAGTPTNAGFQMGVNATTNISNGVTVDLTGLSTFFANLGTGTFFVGETANSGGTGTAGSTLKLAPTSTIIATTLSTDTADGTVTQAIKLGTIANIIQANTITIGGAANRAVATLDFLTTTGTIRIRNLAGTGGAVMNVAAGSTATGFVPVGTVDFTGHSADVLLSTLNIAGRTAAVAAGSTGTYSFDTGAMIATTVTIASRTGTAATSATLTGTLNLMQGAGTTGSATITTLNQGINSASTTTSSGAAVANVNIGGAGTVGITTWNMGNLSTAAAAQAQTAGGPLQVTTNVSGSTTTVGSVVMNVNSSSTTGTNKTSNVTFNISGGTVNVGTGGISMANASNASAAATSTINVTGSGLLTLAGDITRAGGVGTETTNLNLNGANAVIDMSADGSVHNIGSSTATIGAFTFTNGVLRNIGTVFGGITLAGTGEREFNQTGSFSGQVNGVITGAGVGIDKTGTGTVTLLGANTFTGNVDVDGGKLVANLSNGTVNPTSSALGNTQVARNISVNNGGTLQFSSSDTLGGSTSTVLATLVINAGGTVTNDPTGVFNTLGPVQLNGGTLTGVQGSGNAQSQMYSLRGAVTVGGTTASTISGPAAGGTTFGGYHLSANTAFNVADATGNSSSDLNVSGVLIDQANSLGAGGLTKTGVGTMTLSSINTYTGPTVVNGGTLQVGVGGVGSTGTGATAVNNGGTLAGSGTVGGIVGVTNHSIANGGTLSPGDNSGTMIGTLTINGNVDLASGSDTNFKITTASNHDFIDIKGSLTLHSGSTIDLIGLSYANTAQAGDVFTLLDWSSLVANDFSVGSNFRNGGTGGGDLNLQALTNPSLAYDVSNFLNNGSITIVAAPEPGRFMLLGAGALMLALRRRRK